jgi:septal ring factor EnvC (AmiA/AmiB activator)
MARLGVRRVRQNRLRSSGSRCVRSALARGLWIVGLGSSLVVSPVLAQDREEELEGLREAIQESRERVVAHEADERAFLEQLEEVDKRLRSVKGERNRARKELADARRTLEEVEPRLDAASEALSNTQSALAARAVALYRGGEVGPLRVLFSAESLPDLLARASALRVLVRHDAELVERFGEERDELDALREEAAQGIEAREAATRRLNAVAGELAAERNSKGAILARVRTDRKTERGLLLELEQAAQALEETIRSLGRRAKRRGGSSAGTGLVAGKGSLRPPVDAAISGRFGRVVDPEFGTSTFRSGVDFAASAGASVRTVAAGIVRFAGWFRGYGRIVIVDHGAGFHTISGHLDEIEVEVGETLRESKVIGTVGETGSLGGPSLYFEVRRDGEPVDPQEWLLSPRG